MQQVPLRDGAAFGGNPAVGALFPRGTALRGHFCTASVVDSPHGDVLVTAAHCVAGTLAVQARFVPGYHDGQAPLGVWTVTRVVTDQNWASSADPDDDVAFLVVSQPGAAVPVQDVTGGDRLGIGQPAGQVVRVTGYPSAADKPVSCVTRARQFSPGQIEFDCSGFTNGTSGAPLVAGASRSTGLGTVIGVIGGYQHGGNTADVSYAASFGSNVAELYRDAVAQS